MLNAILPYSEDAPPQQSLLRVLTCGSVDDGKSTLIGRLLFDAGAIPDDQLQTLAGDSRRHGSTGADMDLALLVDGLEAEREQGITIDVAYRFFSTPRRSFSLADTPGHEQYTRNMVTGASNADVAILLVDARKGLLVQTKRHAAILSLLGVRDVVLAVNKIDLVAYDQTRFQEIDAAFRSFAADLGFASLQSIPVSARFGDMISHRSPSMPWYRGPALMEYLEEIEPQPATLQPFRFCVQWVNRPNADFRGLSGTVSGGQVRVGDSVIVASSGRETRIARIATADGNRDTAQDGDAVTLVLAEEVDAPRGEVLAPPRDRPTVSTRLAARLVWMTQSPLHIGRSYLLKIGTRTLPATVTAIRGQLDVETLNQRAATTLTLNSIGIVEVETSAPIAFDPYTSNRTTGAFILIDRETHETAAAGLILRGLDAATHVHRHDGALDAQERSLIKAQKPLVVWLTGLSGSGKSTIAGLAERRLHSLGYHTMLLDGDGVRQGLNRDLGFSLEDRREAVRRTGETARLMSEAGLVVLCALVSPVRADRDAVKALFPQDMFVEIFVDTPLEVCRTRDPKGLYAKADAGEIPQFTGVGQAYEPPVVPALILDGVQDDANALAETLVTFLLPRITQNPTTALDSAGL